MCATKTSPSSLNYINSRTGVPSLNTQKSNMAAATEPSTSNTEIGALIPREPVITLPNDKVSTSLQDYVKGLPKIDPITNPELCHCCRSITLDALLKSGIEVKQDAETGETRTLFGSRDHCFSVTWETFSVDTCPLCRLLACDQIWRSGISPHNRKISAESMRLQLEISQKSSLMLRLPEQAGLGKRQC